MVSAWRNFKNIFPRPLLTIIFRPKILFFVTNSILTGQTKVEFVIYWVLITHEKTISNIFCDIRPLYKHIVNSRTQSGTREPRTGSGRSRRQIVDDDSNLNDQEEQMKSLMTKANFDRKTFLFGLGIVQNRVTDIENATVRELQALRDGLTVKAITGM